MISKKFLSLFLFLLRYLRYNAIQKTNKTQQWNETKQEVKTKIRIKKKPGRIGGKGFYYKNSIKISKTVFRACRLYYLIFFFFFVSFFPPICQLKIKFSAPPPD